MLGLVKNKNITVFTFSCKNSPKTVAGALPENTCQTGTTHSFWVG